MTPDLAGRACSSSSGSPLAPVSSVSLTLKESEGMAAFSPKNPFSMVPTYLQLEGKFAGGCLLGLAHLHVNESSGVSGRRDGHLPMAPVTQCPWGFGEGEGWPREGIAIPLRFAPVSSVSLTCRGGEGWPFPYDCPRKSRFRDS